MTTRLKQQGFSLLEILIAFAILALSLSILLRIFSGGVNNAVVAEDYTIAVQIAESLMAKTGVDTPLVAGESAGEENGHYRWRISIIPYLPDPETVDIKALKVLLFKVEVTVNWGDIGESERQVQLSTLKLTSESLNAPG